MAAKEISVKKYVVRLSGEERERLEALLRKGKSPAQRLLKARILLKADISQSGEGWSDSRIIKALETSASMVYRVRKQLVEDGFEAVLSRKRRATPAVARIFDGEKEAKLIALACSKPPKGRARWTLRLLENKVVELHIVDRLHNGRDQRADRRIDRIDLGGQPSGSLMFERSPRGPSWLRGSVHVGWGQHYPGR
jgi:homeodomain-containing protein